MSKKSAKSDISHGNRYPFDASNDWWHSSGGSAPKPTDWAPSASSSPARHEEAQREALIREHHHRQKRSPRCTHIREDWEQVMCVRCYGYFHPDKPGHNTCAECAYYLALSDL